MENSEFRQKAIGLTKTYLVMTGEMTIALAALLCNQECLFLIFLASTIPTSIIGHRLSFQKK